ncbi:hypothetical protein [Lysinibacillus telephonicus]|uniref:hypothetical protein n=1 Tax=Lysinibacillus telephonicus TaxID=1714840 RepID=UPI003B9F0579
MLVKNLIQALQELDQEKEIRISLRNGWRPTGTKSVEMIDYAVDMDTNKVSYFIDVDIHFEYESSKGDEKFVDPKSD